MDFLKTGFVALALAVVLGAFGAHSLENQLTERSLQVWHTGVEYHFIHSIGLILLCILPQKLIRKEKLILYAKRLLLFGLVFFSGSLYLLSTREISGLNLKFLGPITPVGGLLFIAAWVLAALSVSSKPQA